MELISILAQCLSIALFLSQIPFFVLLTLKPKKTDFTRSLVIAGISLLMLLITEVLTQLLALPYTGEDQKLVLLDTVKRWGVRSMIFSSLLCIVATVWRKRVLHISMNISNLILYLVFPLSQILIVNFSKHTSTARIDTVLLVCLPGIWICIIADGLLLYTLLEKSNKEELQAQLREASHARELEKLHYDAVEKQKNEMEQLKQKFQSEIKQIHTMLLSGEQGQSQSRLEELANTIDRTRGARYCPDAVINATLTEEARRCEEKEVPLSVSVTLDHELSIDPVVLCSLFSNLLDNALHAVLVSDTKERYIRVNAATKGDYLIVKVTNSASAASQKKDTSRKHYGQAIIRDIVERYEGKFTAAWVKADQYYEAIATIKLPSEPAA